MVVPRQLIDLLALLVVLDKLDHWGCGQLRPLVLLSETKDAKVSQVATLCELVMIE